MYNLSVLINSSNEEKLKKMFNLNLKAKSSSIDYEIFKKFQKYFALFAVTSSLSIDKFLKVASYLNKPFVKKYNVGIIGYGWVATAHIAAINASPHAQVTAVYPSRQLNDAEVSSKSGSSIRTYTDFDLKRRILCKGKELAFVLH